MYFQLLSCSVCDVVSTYIQTNKVINDCFTLNENKNKLKLTILVRFVYCPHQHQSTTDHYEFPSFNETEGNLIEIF